MRLNSQKISKLFLYTILCSGLIALQLNTYAQVTDSSKAKPEGNLSDDVKITIDTIYTEEKEDDGVIHIDDLLKQDDNLQKTYEEKRAQPDVETIDIDELLNPNRVPPQTQEISIDDLLKEQKIKVPSAEDTAKNTTQSQDTSKTQTIDSTSAEDSTIVIEQDTSKKVAIDTSKSDSNQITIDSSQTNVDSIKIEKPKEKLSVLDSLIARQKFVQDSFARAKREARIAKRKEEQKNSISKKVNPFIGTGGHGHTFPGASAPFGMVQLSPDTRLEGWDGCSGYHFSDDTVYGFTHTHLSGTGVSDYGDILLMPGTGKASLSNGANGEPGYRSHFDKKREKAWASYYETYLTTYRTLVRLTAGWRTGFHQYVYPKGEERWVVLDLNHRDKVLECRLEVEDAYSISGYRRSSAWAEDQVVYFYMQFSEPITRQTKKIDLIESNQKLNPGSASGAVAVLYFDDMKSDTLKVKVGISPTSTKAAKFNMTFDGDHWSFEKRQWATEKLWNRALNKIQIETKSKEDSVIFYTSLYHSMLAPNLFTDIEGSYRGLDGLRHTAKGYQHYTVFSLWDTYRATHPLLTIIDQDRTRDFLKTFAHQYIDGGILPIWELAGNYTGCMIGNHAIPVILDAWQKGITTDEDDMLYQAMKHSLRQDRLGMKAYKATGFVPSEEEGESVSKTLEYAYDDWCMAVAAHRYSKTEDYDLFSKRASNWMNVFDPQTKFMRAKVNNGFVESFDPAEVNFHFTEANSWQYSLYVPQNIPKLRDMLGGEEGLEKRLDEMFEDEEGLSGRNQADITGLIGQYAHGNEPSHHMAYLYNFTGKSWKTQKLTDRIMDEMYSNAPDGLSGNEDCGQMSSWYVFSAMGFYPVTPGNGFYIIGTPRMNSVTIPFDSNTVFHMTANVEDGPYIQSLKRNGKNFDRNWIKHNMIMEGDTFEFEMGPQPNKDWGTSSPPNYPIGNANVIPVPFVKKGNRTFSRSETIELGVIDTSTKIYYTLDPIQEPDKLYREPLKVSTKSTLKFKACNKSGKKCSATITSHFTPIDDSRRIQLPNPPSEMYLGGSHSALIDGIRGGSNFRTGYWQGFQGVDMIAQIKLGAPTKISKISVSYLQDQKSWIWLPDQTLIEVSKNGKDWEKYGLIVNNTDEETEEPVLEMHSKVKEVKAKYIRVTATNKMDIPKWHPGAGGKAWIFADEILVE